MEIHPVASSARRIDNVKTRRILIGEPTKLDRFRRTEIPAEGGEVRSLAIDAGPPKRLAKRKIRGEEIDIFEWRRLIEGRCLETTCNAGHGYPP